MIGQTVAHYRILEKLGQGGMGVVYRAEDTRLGRSVALKALPTDFARDPVRRQRFVQEARAAAALSHAGIASVYALEEVGEELYIAFEYVKGESLRAQVVHGGLELDTLLKMTAGIADALAAAHALGIVHRDLKPENILRTPEGNTKILDFGLARFTAEQQEETASVRLTSAGTIVGTVSYMSPEQLEGKEPDFRSDVFSFGVLLYELATGVRPFDGSSSSSTISRILTAEPAPLVQRNPLAPLELDRIARKCLRKRREERYQSTRDLAVDLENLRRDSGTISREAPTTAAAEDESSILSGALKLTRGSPRRWWEINNLFDLAVLGTLLYLAGTVREWIGGSRGTGMYFGFLAIAAVVLSLRLFLLASAVFNPRRLAEELRRVGPWLRGAEVVMFSLMGVAAALVYGGHPTAAGFLIFLVVGGFFAFLLVEPAMVSSAFPSSAQLPAAGEHARETQLDRERALVAGIQLFYAFPCVWAFLFLAPMLDTIYADLLRGQPQGPGETWSGVISIVLLTAAIVAGVSTGIGILRGSTPALRWFVQWFYAYLLLDVMAIMMMMLFLAKYIHLAAALLALPVVAWLPFYQRQVARRLLGNS